MLLLNSSIDGGSVDNNELLLVVWFDQNAGDQKVYTSTSHFKIMRPSTVTAQGIVEVLQEAMLSLGIQAINRHECAPLIGIGTDRAASNTRREKFSVKIKCKLGWAYKKYRIKERMKTQEDYPAAEKSW